jgi:beta-glucosidase
MGFEIYPEGIYRILKQFSNYKSIKNIVITENGVCVKDDLMNGQVHDPLRIEFFRSYLNQVLKAKQEGVPVSGYLVWSLTDNFEWTEGYKPRFGLVYVDYKSQMRYIKDSGKWFGKHLEQKRNR